MTRLEMRAKFIDHPSTYADIFREKYQVIFLKVQVQIYKEEITRFKYDENIQDKRLRKEQEERADSIFLLMIMIHSSCFILITFGCCYSCSCCLLK